MSEDTVNLRGDLTQAEVEAVTAAAMNAPGGMTCAALSAVAEFRRLRPSPSAESAVVEAMRKALMKITLWGHDEYCAINLRPQVPASNCDCPIGIATAALAAYDDARGGRG